MDDPGMVAVIGATGRRFPMPVWLFERFTGKDLTAMWRWLHTHPVEVDPAATRSIAPSARTVRAWLSSRVR